VPQEVIQEAERVFQLRVTRQGTLRRLPRSSSLKEERSNGINLRL
jgi:hypothetical protein